MVTKQATLTRRSTVLSLPLQLEFPAPTISESLSIHLFPLLPVFLLIVYISDCLSTLLSLYLSVCLSPRLSIYLFFYTTICLCICLFSLLPACLYTCSSVRLPVLLSACYLPGFSSPCPFARLPSARLPAYPSAREIVLISKVLILDLDKVAKKFFFLPIAKCSFFNFLNWILESIERKGQREKERDVDVCGGASTLIIATFCTMTLSILTVTIYRQSA